MMYVVFFNLRTFALVGLSLFTVTNGSCNIGQCDVFKLGDGICDVECLSPDCNYDLGDCCDSSADCSKVLIDNNECDEDCLIPECAFDWDDCADEDDLRRQDVALCALREIDNEFPSLTCSQDKLRNNICEVECNVEECNFDVIDCEEPTFSPSFSPTTEPSVAPSSSPSLSPSIFVSLTPSQAPISQTVDTETPSGAIITTKNPSTIVDTTTPDEELLSGTLLLVFAGLLGFILLITVSATLHRWRQRSRNKTLSKNLFTMSPDSESNTEDYQDSYNSVGLFPADFSTATSGYSRKKKNRYFTSVEALRTTKASRKTSTVNNESEGDVTIISF